MIVVTCIAGYVIGMVVTLLVFCNFTKVVDKWSDGSTCTDPFAVMGSIFWPIGLPCALWYSVVLLVGRALKPGWVERWFKDVLSGRKKIVEQQQYIDSLEEKFKTLERKS